ncbi:MAG: alkaline phosphatase family protein [Candidatus Omnitrophica bacterium]|nr:alkaline phosphatase family protein [Candidatus Omnitrophota bacterium]
MLQLTLMFFAYIDPGAGFTISSAGGWLIVLFAGFFGVFLAFFRRHRKTFIVIGIIVCLVAGGFIMNRRHHDLFKKKLVVIGFDGMSPGIAEKMMSEGRLPNFSRLRTAGSYNRLATANPPQSPVVWASVATGKNPGSNGIFDFIARDPRTYGLRLSIANMAKGHPVHPIKGKTFWEYLSDAKIPTALIQYPMTFPPYRVDGTMLSGMGVPDILGTEGTFLFYTTDAADAGKGTGGKVFKVFKADTMVLNLLGPRVAGIKGPENVKVPFKVTPGRGRDEISIEYQSHKLTLKKGVFSPWQEVEFPIGFLKKVKGIFKFYLVETSPVFKLYVSPVNFDPRDPFFPVSYPRSYSRSLARTIGLYHTQGMPVDTWAVNEMRLDEDQLLRQVDGVFQEKKAMLDFELRRFKKGVLFCYFGALDTVQHMFWRYSDPEHPLYEKDAPAAYRAVIEKWYEKADHVLGDVMTKLGEGDTLLVISDHGFDTFRRVVHLNSWLRKNGYLELRDPAQKQGNELLSDIDWSKTRAYAVGFGGIYLNEEGREKQGIVKPGIESARLKREIAAGLKKWRDEKYGEAVVTNVYFEEDIFKGQYGAMAPDLYVGFNRGYRASWRTAVGGVPDTLIEDNTKKWSGGHLFDPSHVPGILFANKKIVRSSPSVYDIAPTILKAAGIDEKRIKKCRFEGAPLF